MKFTRNHKSEKAGKLNDFKNAKFRDPERFWIPELIQRPTLLL